MQRSPSTVSGSQPGAGSIGPPFKISAHWYARALVLGDIDIHPLISALFLRRQNIQRSRSPKDMSASSTFRHSASYHAGGTGSSFLTSIFQVICGSSPSFDYCLFFKI
jgi:hypothetical protein